MWGSTARVRRPCRPPTSPGTSTSSRWVIIVQTKSDDRGHLSTFFRSGFWGASLYFPRSKHNCRRRRGEYLNHGQRVWLYLITTQTPRAGWGAAKQYFLFQLELNKLLREFYIQELNHSSPAPSVCETMSRKILFWLEWFIRCFTRRPLVWATRWLPPTIAGARWIRIKQFSSIPFVSNFFLKSPLFLRTR